VALILTADDDPATRDVVVRILQRAGHRAIPVADGESALREIRRRRPAVVLADIDLPLINGFLLCDEVRRDPLLAQTPVILTTATPDPADRRATEVRATALLVKPFTADDLLIYIDKHLPATPDDAPGGPDADPPG
jgi:twitching motility two-component system response regulator PilH